MSIIVWRIIGVVSIISGTIGMEKNLQKIIGRFWSITDLSLCTNSPTIIIMLSKSKQTSIRKNL